MAAPPIVDLSARTRPGSPLDDLVEAIDAACTEIGFFVVVGHGLESALDQVFAAAHSLFELPQVDKESFAMIERQGFVPARHRVIDTTLHSAPMEYFDVGLSGAQRWPSPSVLDGFREVVDNYQSAVLSLAADILRLMATALALDPSFFAARMTDPQCFLRMMHYEPCPAGPDGQPQVLADPHTDYGLVTLLATDGVGGLEVRSRDGEWTMVSAPNRSLVVNLGDMLARWTNDRYVSTPHRVSAPVASDRFSVPFFVNPDPSTTVSCLPSCVTDLHPCGYPPVTASEFLAKRIADGGYMTRPST